MMGSAKRLRTGTRLGINLLLEPKSCAPIRSLIERYTEAPFGRARSHPSPKSGWCHLAMARLPAPIAVPDIEFYRSVARKITTRQSAFIVDFGRPYSSKYAQLNHVALESSSLGLSKMARELHSELFLFMESQAYKWERIVGGDHGRIVRSDILRLPSRLLKPGFATAKLAMRRTDDECATILKDLKATPGGFRCSTKAIGLTLVCFGNREIGEPRIKWEDQFLFSTSKTHTDESQANGEDSTIAIGKKE